MESPAAGVMLPRSGESEFRVWLLSSRTAAASIRNASRSCCAFDVARANGERDRQALRSVDAERRSPGGALADGRAADAGREGGQRLLKLRARQRGAQAVVRAVPERQVRRLGALRRIELLRIRVHPLVVVGAPGREEDALAR